MYQDIADTYAGLRGPRGPRGRPLPTHLEPGAGQECSTTTVPWASRTRNPVACFDRADEGAEQGAADVEAGPAHEDGPVVSNAGHSNTVGYDRSRPRGWARWFTFRRCPHDWAGAIRPGSPWCGRSVLWISSNRWICSCRCSRVSARGCLSKKRNRV